MSRIRSLGRGISLLCLLYSQSSFATNGFLSHCTGAAKCATGGAGVAKASDSVDAAINPALIANRESNFSGTLGMFRPIRTMDTSKAPLGNRDVGNQKSALNSFPEGAFGISYEINDRLTAGVALAGSGGMATKYGKPRSWPTAQINGPFDRKIFYRLAHLTPSIAYRANENLSFGASLIVGYSDIKTDSSKVTPQGALAQTDGKDKRQNSIGYGARVGALWNFREKWSFGASYATPVHFKRFSKYKDIFIGPLNTPANFTVGTLWTPIEDIDLLLDVKRILYGKVTILGKTPENGGFGWRDQTVFMAGVTKRYRSLSFSLGYNYGKSPIKKDRTFANALLPAVVESHFTYGASYKANEGLELFLSGFYAPKKTQTDPGTGDKFSAFGKDTSVSMYQYGLSLGLRYNL